MSCTLAVHDLDEALCFYRDLLGFKAHEDGELVGVSPPSQCHFRTHRGHGCRGDTRTHRPALWRPRLRLPRPFREHAALHPTPPRLKLAMTPDPSTRPGQGRAPGTRIGRPRRGRTAG
ncbi:VOC family protein [Amycolatopsis sp. WAC 04182]|uniref:VOC family protein n=1 Tax=Amycolatopsis sp. WAC 04182 TaxID=2203198 RepID=UPI00351290BF